MANTNALALNTIFIGIQLQLDDGHQAINARSLDKFGILSQY